MIALLIALALGQNTNGTTQQLGYSSAFGEAMTTQPTVENFLSFEYNCNTELVSTSVDAGSAVCTAPHAIMAADGGFATLTSRRFTKYVPGVGLSFRFAGMFSACDAGQQEVGLGNAHDGLFFGCCSSCGLDGGSSFAILRRSNDVDNWTPEGAWNAPKLSLDYTKGNVYQASFQWLGYGALTFARENPVTGLFQNVHQVRYANTATSPSFRNPSLPLHIAAHGRATVKVSSMSTIRQGAVSTYGIVHSASASKAVATSAVPVLAIHNKTTFASVENRVTTKITMLSVSNTGGQTITVLLVRNPVLTGAAYADVSTDTSVQEVATTITSYTNGTNLLSVVLEPGATQVIPLIDYPRLDQLPDETILVSGKSSSGTPNLSVGLSWREEF